MKKTKFQKWSYLLVTALFVVILATMTAPAAVLAEDGTPCQPCDCPQGSRLQVNIVMPENGASINEGDYFWVNATVARPSEVTADVHNVFAEICIEGDACLVDCSQKQGPVDLDNCWEVRDFWWRLQCTGDDPANITVNAWGDGILGDCDAITVKQIERPCDKLEVSIIECPEAPIMPSTVFAVKALVKNVTDYEICDVNTEIEISGPASLMPSNPNPCWNIGSIRPGCTEEVAWTLHCDGGGDVKIDVEAEFDDCQAKDTCVVHQICEANFACRLGTLPEKICVNCDNCFPVRFTVTNTCPYTPIECVVATLHVEGDAHINGSPEVGIPVLSGGGSYTFEWQVCCDGGGPAQIWAEATGYDPTFNKQIACQTSPKTVAQVEPLMVTIMGPADNEEISVGQEFQLKYRLTNCTPDQITNIIAGMCVAKAPCVKLASTTVQVIPDPQSGVQPYTLTAEQVDGCYRVIVPCVLNCCYVDLVWDLQCCCSGLCDVQREGSCGGDCTWVCQDMLEAYAALVPGQWVDSDTVKVKQMNPPCLTASIEAYEGVMSMGSFECETHITRVSGGAIVPGEYFTVVVPVANLGEAMAEDVGVTLSVSGPAALLPGQSLTQQLGDIECHGAAKAVWEFRCTGEGVVQFNVTGLSGIDANNGEAITCIYKGCVVYVDQIPLRVQVIQPLTCTSFIEGDSFAVKVKICNNSTKGITLSDVKAQLCWWGQGGMSLADGQGNPVGVGELKPGECAEATWQMRCCEDGDVTFKVNVWNDCPPFIDIASSTETIHQFDPGHICCYILSPNLKDYDLCCEPGSPEAYIATGQEFSVVAKLFNSGDRPFTVNEIQLSDKNGGEIEIMAGPDVQWPDPQNPGVLAKRQYAIVSWDVVCTEAGPTELEVKVSGEDDMGTKDCCEHDVCIMQYPAAHLVVEFTDYPSEDIVTSTEFPITAKITNVGEADAWGVQAHLSVFPDTSVRISASDPDGGYTKDLGNLIGHDVNESESVTWLLHCKEVCDSTITITVTGYDEYGYEVKQICTSEIIGTPNPGTFQITCCDLLLDGTPGAPIQSRFIEPDSITVKQVEDDGNGDGNGDDGNLDVQLSPGWNLVSMPWYIPSDNRDPDDLLVDILDNLEAVYAYDPCDEEFSTYGPGIPGTLTEVRDGSGYWFLMNAADVLTVLAPPAGGGVPPTYAVDCIGYNLIGPRIGEEPMPCGEWLYELHVSAVLGYDNANDVYFIVRADDLVYPGQGYWVFFTQPGIRAW